MQSPGRAADDWCGGRGSSDGHNKTRPHRGCTAIVNVVSGVLTVADKGDSVTKSLHSLTTRLSTK